MVIPCYPERGARDEGPKSEISEVLCQNSQTKTLQTSKDGRENRLKIGESRSRRDDRGGFWPRRSVPALLEPFSEKSPCAHEI